MARPAIVEGRPGLASKATAAISTGIVRLPSPKLEPNFRLS